MYLRCETIWMWAEHGDALFWTGEGVCCGDSRGLVTSNRQKRIDLTDIDGLQGWYDRFDDDVYPAYIWPLTEYQEWVKEGWKYALAVRRILPDEIELLYDSDEDGNPYTVYRDQRILPCKPKVSDTRLIQEAIHFILSSHDRTLDLSPYVDFIEAFCRCCPYEELIEPTHCHWDKDKEELTIQWYMDSMDCHISFGRCIRARKECWGGNWTIGERRALVQSLMPVIGWVSSSFEFENGKVDLDYFFEKLSWLILDRGLK